MTPLDARTLDAMRVLTARYNAGDPDEARDVLRAFLAAYDASTAASRDEALAVLILNRMWMVEYKTYADAVKCYDRTLPRILKSIPEIRAHIAKEQAQ